MQGLFFHFWFLGTQLRATGDMLLWRLFFPFRFLGTRLRVTGEVLLQTLFFPFQFLGTRLRTTGHVLLQRLFFPFRFLGTRLRVTGEVLLWGLFFPFWFLGTQLRATGEVLLQTLFFPFRFLGTVFLHRLETRKPSTLLTLWPGQLQRPPGRSRFHLGFQATLCAQLSLTRSPRRAQRGVRSGRQPHLLSAVSGLCSPARPTCFLQGLGLGGDIRVGPPHHREGLEAVAGFSSFWGTQLLGGVSADVGPHS